MDAKTFARFADRAAARRADVTQDRRGASVLAGLDAHLGRDAVLRPDGGGLQDLLASRRGLPHSRLDATTGHRVIDTAFHIQTANTLRGRLDTFLRPFCGPATTNLPRRLDRFPTRLGADPANATETASTRALGA